MENPGRLIHRAKLNRQNKNRVRTADSAPQESRQPEYAQHVSHHASYTALMRSHDRVRSRHGGMQG